MGVELRAVGWVVAMLVGALASCLGGGYAVESMVRAGAPVWATIAVFLGCLLVGSTWVTVSIVLATRR